VRLTCALVLAAGLAATCIPPTKGGVSYLERQVDRQEQNLEVQVVRSSVRSLLQDSDAAGDQPSLSDLLGAPAGGSNTLDGTTVSELPSTDGLDRIELTVGGQHYCVTTPSGQNPNPSNVQIDPWPGECQ